MQTIRLFQANFRKQLVEMKRYAPNAIAQFMTIYIIFIGMFYGLQLIGSPESQAVTVQYTIVSYIFWYLSLNIVNGMGYEIASEATRGTFEQLGMSPSGIWRILTVRLLASSLLNSIAIIALLYLSMLTTGEWLNLDFISILPIFILTCASMFGLSFIIAGLTIVLKQIQAFLQVFQFILAGLTFISLTTPIYQLILPFTKGLQMIRAIMIENYHITDFSYLDFVILIVNALLYLGIGLTLYLSCERYARQKGLLGQY
ncbi:ABC transporter permease [Amphibacillus indicireducens]|uniref:ABC transporter permease n=1 Tax=Amphibacillus indicireducens TaxID=1076330 RepID=A0ABP7VBL2_9BACI